MYLSALRCNHFIHRWHFFRSSYLYFIKTNQCVIPTTKLFYSLWSYNAYSPNFWLNHFKNVRSTSVYVCVCVLFAQSCPIFCDPMDCNLWASLSMKFSRQEYWSGLPFPAPGDLPNPGIEPRSLSLQADPLPSEPPGKLQGVQGGEQRWGPLCSRQHWRRVFRLSDIFRNRFYEPNFCISPYIEKH